MFGKSAYGRPQASSRRYSNLFYIKQKLRAFHGKVKEDAFRNLFKNHLIQIAVQTNSFFSVLESRLDRIFFRIRLLPTIFACHQFIHYKGLEINHQLEKSPRKEVKIGDIITVPAQA
jgi:ribosomal protein S4